jgi:hypothetical protein
MNPVGYSYLGKVLNLAVRPWVGGRFIVNENGHVWEATGGGEAFGYLGRRVGFYVNVKQTWQSEALVQPEYFTMEEGKVWKELEGGAVRSTEWRGGLSVGWNWGDFGVYKDRPVWGNAQHGSNILSGHAPSFPFIQLHLKPAKWFEFRYIHGWLKSNVVDSARSDFSGPGNQTVFFNKYIAANLFTITPWKWLDFSFGNSIIYESRNPQAAYLIPFMFFNSVDAMLSDYNNPAGQNSQMFFNIHVLPVRHLSVYGALFIDEISVSNAFNEAKQSNLLSWKVGFQVVDYPFRNLTLTGEYTRSNPMVYKHNIPTTSFYSDGYVLGHYLRDNADEVFLELAYKPLKGFTTRIGCSVARAGEDYPYIQRNYGIPFIAETVWRTANLSVSFEYKVFQQVEVMLGYRYGNHSGDVRYDPEMMCGHTNTFSGGIQIGL